MNKKAVRELVRYARLKGLDEISEVQDYLAEKDSHFSRRKVERIIAEAMQEKKHGTL
jgi:hypothetical protein